MISNIFDNIKRVNVLNLLTKIYNHNNSNNSNNSRYYKFISFSINNRSSHFKQLTKVVTKDF